MFLEFTAWTERMHDRDESQPEGTRNNCMDDNLNCKEARRTQEQENFGLSTSQAPPTLEQQQNRMPHQPSRSVRRESV